MVVANEKKPAANVVAQSANADQNMAAIRDDLILRGSRLSGFGLSGQRVEWGTDMLAYAFTRSGGKVEMCAHIINELHLNIISSSVEKMGIHGKVTRDDTLHQSIRLAQVYQEIPQVKLMDWTVARLFNKFLTGYNPAKPKFQHLEAGKQLAKDVVLRKYLKENGCVDAGAVRDAINAIFGIEKKEKAEKISPAGSEEVKEPEVAPLAPAVTSEEAVAAWLEIATQEQLIMVAKKLSQGQREVAANVFVEFMKG